MRTVLVAAILALSNSSSEAAECRYTEIIQALSDAAWTCRDEIEKAVPDLKSPDAQTRRLAAQRIAAMSAESDRMLEYLEKEKQKFDAKYDAAKGQWTDPEAQRDAPAIAPARSVIVDLIRKEFKDAIDSAKQINSAPAPAGKDKPGRPDDAQAANRGREASGKGAGPQNQADPGEQGGRGGSTDQGFQNGAASMAQAQRLAEGLKPNPSDEGMAMPGAKRPDESRAKAALGGSAQGPSSELAFLAASGFGASFKEAGLKMGSGPHAGQVVRNDGSPASPEDLSRLRRQIAKDPEALMRRPDFFDVIGRPGLERLKTDFATKPEERDRAFRHVGMTEAERDFLRTQTCDKNMEKGCNALAAGPYRKGEFVSPEDLKRTDDALHPGEEEDRGEPRDVRLEAAIAADQLRRRLVDGGGIYSKINGVIRGFRQFLLGESGGKGDPAAAVVSARGAGGWFSRRAAVAFTDRAKGASQTPPMPGAAPGNSGPAKRWPWVLLAAALAGAGLWLTRKAP